MRTLTPPQFIEYRNLAVVSLSIHGNLQRNWTPKLFFFRLGELIFGSNRKKEEELKTLRKRYDGIALSPIAVSRVDPSFSVLSKDPLKSSSRRRNRNNPKTSTVVNSLQDESTIESLIDKMKSGMEVGAFEMKKSIWS